jgi:DNA-binding CsgD family transcriptional regulator
MRHPCQGELTEIGTPGVAIHVPAVVQDAVSGLYAGAFEHSFERFKENTLQSLRRLLSFDSAVWGSGVHSTNAMLSLTLVDQPVDMLLSYANGWQAEDQCRTAAVAEPGRAFRNEDLQPIDEYRRSAIYNEFCIPWNMEQALTIVQVRKARDLAEIVCLFRADKDSFFTDQERALLEHLAPHMAAAWHQAQIAHFHRRAGFGDSIGVLEPERFCIVDLQGFVRAAGDTFCEAVMSFAPEWTGPLLPNALIPLVCGEQATITVGGIEFRKRHLLDHVVLAASPADGALGLTRAELRVASLYADGLTQSSIAGRLGVSPSTVRNQLASVYGKLQVHSKVDLVRVLRGS